jgi:hypothetical protein
VDGVLQQQADCSSNHASCCYAEVTQQQYGSFVCGALAVAAAAAAFAGY